MENAILEAIQSADANLREEFLKPFGVKTFPQLMSEWKRLKGIETKFVKEQEVKAQEAELTEHVATLKAAGIEVEGINDVRVKSYAKLDESERGEFIGKIGTKPKGSNGDSTTAVRNPDAFRNPHAKDPLAESVKATELFPEKV